MNKEKKLLLFSGCPTGRFGHNCRNECHCMDSSEQCDSVQGRCQSGCARGWSGLDCQTSAYISVTCLLCLKGVEHNLCLGYICFIDVAIQHLAFAIHTDKQCTKILFCITTVAFISSILENTVKNE